MDVRRMVGGALRGWPLGGDAEPASSPTSSTLSGTVRVVGFLVSLAAFVLVRHLTRGLPWLLSMALAVVAMLVAGRFAGVVAVDVVARLRRRRQPARWE